MKKKTGNQLINEMMGGENHDLFVVPEEGKIDLLSNTPEWEKITISIGKEIQKEISREEYIQGLLEKIFSKNEKDPIQGIKSFVKYCLESEKNVYNELFSPTLETGQEVHENEALAREVLNHCLGVRGRNKGFTQTQRELLKQQFFSLNQTYEGDDVFSHLMTMMPASLQGASKSELMCKVSIMMLLIAQSHPEKFAKMDEFFEKQVVIDAMLAGKTFSEMIDELLSYAGTFEAKNTGSLYNYRVDDLFHFARAAKEGLANIPEFLGQNMLTDALKRHGAKKNDPVLRVFQDRYKKTQKQMRINQGADLNDKELYVVYGLANKQYYDSMRHEKDMQFVKHILAITSSGEIQTGTIQIDSNNHLLLIDDHQAISYLTERQSYQPDASYIISIGLAIRKYKKKLFIERFDAVDLENVSQLDERLIALCIEYYHDKPDFIEQILQTQKLSDDQMLLLDKKRAEQEKLKNYNERLAIHRQGVRDTLKMKNIGINRDAVFEFCKDSKNIYTTVDSLSGDISVRLPKCGPKGMKIKLMNLDGFSDDDKSVVLDKEMMSKTQSQSSQEFLYRSLIDSDDFRKKIDDALKEGYTRDAKKFDKVMFYFAKQFGLTYQPNERFDQSVFCLYMAIVGRIGWEWINKNLEGMNGDIYGKIKGKYTFQYQVAKINSYGNKFDHYGNYNYISTSIFQSKSNPHLGSDSAYLSLIGDND